MSFKYPCRWRPFQRADETGSGALPAFIARSRTWWRSKVTAVFCQSEGLACPPWFKLRLSSPVFLCASANESSNALSSVRLRVSAVRYWGDRGGGSVHGGGPLSWVEDTLRAI